MSTIRLGPWMQGIVNTVRAEALPSDALLDAVNVDIGREGSIERRAGWEVIESTPSHSLFCHGDTVYGVVGNELGIIRDDGFTPLATVSRRLSWTVLNGNPVFSDYVGVGVIDGHQVVSLPSEISEEEAELALAPLPGGQWISYWRGRLLVARGTTLIFSEPLRYGVYDQLRGFISFEERISWLAPLDSGIFVGLRHSVRFLRGKGMEELEQNVVAGASWKGAATVISTAGMDPELVRGVDYVALWMTEKGFALGLPSGEVVFPQQKRLRGIPLHEGKLVVLDDRVVVLSN